MKKKKLMETCFFLKKCIPSPQKREASVLNQWLDSLEGFLEAGLVVHLGLLHDISRAKRDRRVFGLEHQNTSAQDCQVAAAYSLMTLVTYSSDCSVATPGSRRLTKLRQHW